MDNDAGQGLQPLQPTIATVKGAVAEEAAVEPVYGGFWLRFYAAGIDGFLVSILLGLVIGGISLLIVTLGAHFTVDKDLVNLLVTVFLSAVFLSSKWQATPGKRLFGLTVTCHKGGRIGFFRALLRVSALPVLVVLVHLVLVLGGVIDVTALQQEAEMYRYQIVSIGATLLIMLAWFIPVIFTAEKTALHDLICHTRVLRDVEKSLFWGYALFWGGLILLTAIGVAVGLYLAPTG